MSSPTPLASFRFWLEKRPLRRLALVFALLALVVYSGMPAEELTFDNSFIIGDDTRLRNFDLESILQIVRHDYWWPSLTSSLYRPLTTFSFWLEYSFLGYGEAPLGYQAANLALHVVNVLLLVLLAIRLGLGRLAAYAVGAIYLVHPIATEAVANIVGRSDLFAATAVLGGLLCYFNGLEEKTRGGRWRWFLACGACGLLGVMAKESAIMLPALVGLHGLLRMGELRQAETARVWVGDAVGAGLSLAACAVFILVTRSIFTDQPGVSDHPFMDNPLMVEGFWVTRITALAVWGMQVQALFLPLSLSSDYSFNAIPVANLDTWNATTWWGVGTGAGFVVLAVVLWRVRKTVPTAAFLWGAYVIAMLPTSNLLIKIGSIRADRFHYLPSAFFWLGLAVLILHAVRWLRRYNEERGAFVLRAGAGVLIAWTLCLAVMTHFRCYDWRSNLTLWQSALVNAPGSAKTAAAVANVTVQAANTIESAEAALARIEQALQPYAELGIEQSHWPVALFSDYTAFSTTLYDMKRVLPGREEEARAHLEEAIRWAEKAVEVQEAMRRRWADRWAGGDIAQSPRMGLMHKNYAVALMRAERFEEAVAQLDLLLARQPYMADYRELRALIYKDMGRVNESARELMLLSVMERDSANYIFNLGNVIKQLHPESEPVVRDAQGALRLDLSDPFVLQLLSEASSTYLQMRKEEGAMVAVRRFVRLARHSYGIELAK